MQDLLEQRDNVIDGTVVPINLNEPNPNGYKNFIFHIYDDDVLFEYFASI